ncbi:MAG: DUF429 domain-containing protein [Actinomycetota bacterium]|nr:DUF429 domain-containing protein [Actinomycetota bacterium]
MAKAQWVAGVDGAQKGWVVAYLPSNHDREAYLTRYETFQQVKASVEELRCSSVGVDMPIGLQLTGTRTSDCEARNRLGRRRSTLFPTPSSVVLEATSYEDALKRSREQTGKGLSIQTWNLIPQIREVRNTIQPVDSDIFIECHPESSFVAMVGDSLVSKKTPEGIEQRLTALQNIVPNIDTIVEALPKKCSIDDALDAFAAAWSAKRHSQGEAIILGGDEYDEQGYPLRVVI